VSDAGGSRRCYRAVFSALADHPLLQGAPNVVGGWGDSAGTPGWASSSVLEGCPYGVTGCTVTLVLRTGVCVNSYCSNGTRSHGEGPQVCRKVGRDYSQPQGMFSHFETGRSGVGECARESARSLSRASEREKDLAGEKYLGGANFIENTSTSCKSPRLRISVRV